MPNVEEQADRAGAESVRMPAAETENPASALIAGLSAQLRAGTTVDGKYVVERILGRGGMGLVVAATHAGLNKRVALKFLEVKDDEVSDDFRGRFALEARVCAKLKNDHIARVHDVGIWMGKFPFMVMDYLDGEDLRRLQKRQGRLPLGQAVEYAVQICEGLAEAHAQGIVHRDLKPPNIFITKRHDGTDLVKVLDFGISKWASIGDELSELTQAGVMLGSPKYMSPEQLNGSLVDSRSDIWSIGAILYGMLSGRPAYDFPQVTQTFMAIATGAKVSPPSKWEPSIPPEVDAVILRCLTLQRDQRFQNVADLAGALLEAVGSPFAKEARAHIASVLEPGEAPSLRPGLLSITTGTHVAFARGSITGSGEISASDISGVNATLPVLRESSVPAPQRTKSARSTKAWWGIGAAVAALGLAAMMRGPATSASPSAGRARAFDPKALVREPASALAAVTTTSVGATIPSEPTNAESAAAPVPVTLSTRSTPSSRESARRATHTAPAQPQATSVASPFLPPPQAPASTPTARPSASARASNALEDRQ